MNDLIRFVKTKALFIVSIPGNHVRVSEIKLISVCMHKICLIYCCYTWKSCEN